MHLELRQLRYFVAVAEELHFGRAATKLGMTQPPLSQAIQSLESHLGTALFFRSTRHIALTAAGIAMLPEARKILHLSHMLPQLALRAASGASGHLTLAFVSIADYSILPPFLRLFRGKNPSISIELREATSDIQLISLQQNEIDAGFLIPPIPDHLHSSISYQKILSEPLMLAVPESNFLASSNNPLNDYKQLPLIIFPRKIAPALHDLILGCFRELGLTPSIGQEANQMQTIIGLVSAGMGIALVPQSVSNLKRAGVVYLNLPKSNNTVEIGVAWRTDNMPPALRIFLDLLSEKEIYADPPKS